MLPVSLDCSFLIATSVFSNVRSLKQSWSTPINKANNSLSPQTIWYTKRPWHMTLEIQFCDWNRHNNGELVSNPPILIIINIGGLETSSPLLCLFQSQNWISNVICHGLFVYQMVWGDNELLALLIGVDHDCLSERTLENTEVAIKNEQSRETGNIGYTRRRKSYLRL